MNRQNQILTAILALQIALGAFIFWPKGATSGGGGGPLLADYSPVAVQAVTITDGDGNRVALQKSGDGWVLSEADDFPADGERVLELLDKIGKIETNRQVTQTEASHKRLKVADDAFVRKIEISLSDGSRHTLYLGTSPRSSATHVRADDRPQTYLTGELRSYEANARAASWIDTIYYTVPKTATLSLKLENENGVFEFEQTEPGMWTMKGLAEDETFNRIVFNGLFNQAISPRMNEPIGKTEEDWFKMDSPTAVVTLKMKDGKTYTLRIGAQDEASNDYVAKWSESPYYVKLTGFSGGAFVNKTRDDFIEATPTPTPETGDEASGGGG